MKFIACPWACSQGTMEAGCKQAGCEAETVALFTRMPGSGITPNLSRHQCSDRFAKIDSIRGTARGGGQWHDPALHPSLHEWRSGIPFLLSN